MRLPIQYAFSYPERWGTAASRLDLASCGPLEFHAPDLERFPCLGLAYEALEAGGTMPVVLNAANEVAVEAFLRGAHRLYGHLRRDCRDHGRSHRCAGRDAPGRARRRSVGA